MTTQLTALIATIFWLQATAVPTGNHTCTGVIKHPVNVLVNVTEPVTFRSYTWCLRVPPRCSKYTVQLKDRVKLHVEMHNKTITVCCEGYVEMEGKCVPACPPGADCPFMRCNRTNHCHCTPGYTGLYCNEACPRGLWGKDCKRPCDCPSGYTCHHLTGDCFVDDRPPRRTTTPSTTTTTSKPTTITTPTTEGTTLETVKTPVFRFPPPPWVESATVSKKTTTRQVNKDEAISPKIQDIQENFEVITKKTLIDITLPTLQTKISNKTSIERPTTIELFPHQSNEDKVNQKPEHNSTTIKEQQTIKDYPVNILPTVPSKLLEKDVSKSNEQNSINKINTFQKEITTPIPVSSSPELQNTLQQPSVTTDPSPTVFTNNNSLSSSTDSSVLTKVTVHADTTYIASTELPVTEPLKPVELSVTPSTRQTSYNTRTAKNTFVNEIPIQTIQTTSHKHTTESILQSTIYNDIPSMEPKSSVNTNFAANTNEFRSTAAVIIKTDVDINGNGTTLDNQNVSTTPVRRTKASYLEEYLTRILTGIETSTESNIKGSISTTFNKTLFPLTQGITLLPLKPVTKEPYLTSSRIPNYDITVNPISTTPYTFDHIILKRTTDITSFKDISSEAKTTQNLFTAPTVLTTTSDDPKADYHNTLTELRATAVPNTSSPTPSSQTNITSNMKNITTTANLSTDINSSTFSQNRSPVTSTTEQTTLSILKKVYPINTTNIKLTTFPILIELTEKENNQGTAKPHINETQPVKLPTPVLSTDVYKDLNGQGKAKSDEIHSVHSGQDKQKKKQEKIKPKNTNAKDFPPIHQSKTEKHNETLMQTTTEISLRSILQAETFRTLATTTKLPTNHTISQSPPSNYRNLQPVTNGRREVESAINVPTKRPNQMWHGLRKENVTNAESKDQNTLITSIELSGISESTLALSENNRVMESNTIDYRQSSEEPMKKVIAEEEETNYSLLFNKIKFNMTDSIAAGVKLPKEERSYIHLPMILVLGVALLTLLLLTLTLWVYLKRRRQQAEPFPPYIMAYAMEEPQPLDCDTFDQAFFCPTFTNNYAQRINRELHELHYDHPKSRQPEPLYAEIFN